MVSNTTYPFSCHRHPCAPSVNQMPSFCAMAKECDIFSFELHSNMLNLHWNVDLLNQRFLFLQELEFYMPVDHQNGKIWPPLHWEKNGFCFVFAWRTIIPVWLYGRLNKRLNHIARFRVSAVVPKCQPYFISDDTELQRYLNWLSATTSGRSPYDFLLTTRCSACGDKQTR